MEAKISLLYISTMRNKENSKKTKKMRFFLFLCLFATVAFGQYDLFFGYTREECATMPDCVHHHKTALYRSLLEDHASFLKAVEECPPQCFSEPPIQSPNYTILHWASLHRKPYAVLELLKRCDPLKLAGPGGTTAFMETVLAQDYTMVLVFAQSEKFNEMLELPSSARGYPPLLETVARNNTDMAIFLLNTFKQINPNGYSTDKKNFPLLMALALENVAMLDALMKSPNILVNQTDAHGCITMNTAFPNGNLAVIDTLLQRDPIQQMHFKCYDVSPMDTLSTVGYLERLWPERLRGPFKRDKFIADVNTILAKKGLTITRPADLHGDNDDVKHEEL